MIVLKRPEEIEIMKKANGIVADCLFMIEEKIKPGINTFMLDKAIEDLILSSGGIPSFKGYQGFPNASCISVNEEVVHGIPSEKVILKEGDIVSIDIGVFIDGFHGDGARTYPVGMVSDIAKRLMEVTRKALEIAIKTAEKAERLGEISYSIQTYIEENGFSVIREYVGHGIGRSIHEQPQIPNYGEKRAGPKLRPGMVLAIEPMVSSGDWRTETLKDGWTAITSDHSLSAHFEDTVALTENGVQVLTRSNRGEKNTKREE